MKLYRKVVQIVYFGYNDRGNEPIVGKSPEVFEEYLDQLIEDEKLIHRPSYTSRIYERYIFYKEEE